MLMRLTLALTMLAPTPSQKEADAAYNAGEYRKALDLFLARAADPSVHRPDALHGAHDSLNALYDETAEAEHLCRALKITRKVLAVETFTDAGERAAWVALEAKDVARIKRAGVTCTATRKKSPAATPAVAASRSTSAAPTPAPAAETLPPAEDEALVPVTGRPQQDPDEADPPALLVTPPLGGSDRPAGDVPAPALLTVPPWSSDDADTHTGKTPTRSPVPSRGRGLVIAGGLTLTAGLGLTAAAGYLGGGMLDMWRGSRALHREVGPFGTEEQADHHAALVRDYERQKVPTVVTAVAGVGAIVVGAVLVGVGAKRLVRASSHAALLPTPGGLVLRARF